MEIFGRIEGISYKPFLCKPMSSYSISDLDQALSEKSNFVIKINGNNLAVSWWVSPKRTRSYPYARVYDTLSFAGKKVAIIPLMKDEGKEGDRDFLQWDTVSLMSLLGIYVIIGYYVDADKNPKYENKITNQRFDVEYLKGEFENLISYQSDALHWNLKQIDKISLIAEKALNAYENISRRLSVKMHSLDLAQKRIEALFKSKENFLKLSRKLARQAQRRESTTIQPKEYVNGKKGMLTIKNYLGGYYYFTCDEVEIHENKLYLIEGKHTNSRKLPSESDIKDGLIKMILYTNLKEVKVNEKDYESIAVLKLTTKGEFSLNLLTKRERRLLDFLKEEATYNKFKIKLNETFVV